MGITINRRERTKQDYQIKVVLDGVAFALSIVSLILFIKENK